MFSAKNAARHAIWRLGRAAMPTPSQASQVTAIRHGLRASPANPSNVS